MKLGFIADVHIKLGQKNVPSEWTLNRFDLLFQQIKGHEHKVDAWIIGGDIFDRIPTVEEMQVFFQFVQTFGKPTIMYDGNHEALKKNTTFLSYLKDVTNRINHNVRIVDDYHSEWGVDFIPYCRLKQFAKGEHPEFTNKICASHFRAEIPPHVKPEIDLELFSKWEVVLAGDLHSYDNCQRNILYPGSPVTTSFHRGLVDTGFIVLDTDTLVHEWIKFSLPQLIRKTLNVGEAMVATEYHHTIYEVEGDMAELAGLEDNGLLDKKVVKREVDTALILDPKLTLTQEVSEYLKYILLLDDETVDNVLKEFANHAGNSI